MVLILKAMIESFCAYQVMRGFSPRTVGRRRWTLDKLTENVSGGAELLSLTSADIESWLSTYPGVQTRYSLRADVHQFYLWAVRKGHTESDPTLGVEPPKLPKRLPTPIAAVDVRRLIDSCTGDDLALVLLAAQAGLRVSEIAALTSSDIVHGCVTVRCGKGGRDRVVPLSSEAIAAIPQRTGDLFPRQANGQAVSARIRRLLRALCIAGRPHDLRHSFGTELARNHVDLVVIAQLMGHESIETTRGYVLLAAPDRNLVENLYRGRAA